MSDQVPLNVQNSYPASEYSANESGQMASENAPIFGQDAFPQPQANPFAVNQSEGNGFNSQASLAELDDEARRLRELSAQMDSIAHLQSNPESSSQNTHQNPSQSQEQEGSGEQKPEDLVKTEVDARSVYVGNVDYGSTPVELQQHFSPAGVVERVTILSNKLTGQPKGFAYVEFASPEEASQAVAMMDGSQFRDRELKVSQKRTNVPGLSTTNRGGFRGRGRGRGMMRGRGRGFRGRGFRGGGRFTPY